MPTCTSVAAVAPAVAAHEETSARAGRLAGHRPARAHPAPELLADDARPRTPRRRTSISAERLAATPKASSAAERRQRDHDRATGSCAARWPASPAARRSPGRCPRAARARARAGPCSGRTTAARRAAFVARHRLGDEREERAPEDHEAQPDEHEVVEQEDRLARQQRVEPVLGAQVGAPGDDQRRPSPRQHARSATRRARRASRRRTRGSSRGSPSARGTCRGSRACRSRGSATTFQTFSIPRFSWIITECRNAVPVSHGISEAFSTGSHAQ